MGWVLTRREAAKLMQIGRMSSELARSRRDWSVLKPEDLI